MRVFEQVVFACEIYYDALFAQPRAHRQQVQAHRVAGREYLGDACEREECSLIVGDDFALNDGGVFHREVDVGHEWQTEHGRSGRSGDSWWRCSSYGCHDDLTSCGFEFVVLVADYGRASRPQFVKVNLPLVAAVVRDLRVDDLG